MTAPGSHTGADLPRSESPTPVSGEDVGLAERLRSAVAGLPAVAAVATTTNEVPGHDVAGIRVTDDTVEIHVVAVYSTPLVTVGDRVGDAVAGLVAGRTVHVFVDDVLDPHESSAR